MTVFETLWTGVKRESNLCHPRSTDMNSLTVIMPPHHQQQHQTTQVKPIAPRLNNKQQLPKEIRSIINSEVDSTTTLTTKNSNKRKIVLHPSRGYAIPPPIAPKVARRNARERNRVKQVNSGFDVLRSHIPTAAKHKKMSKVDTLRHAVDYIRNLKKMLKEQDFSNGIKTELEDSDFENDDDFNFDDETSQQSFNDSTASNASSPPASTSFPTSTTATTTTPASQRQQQQQPQYTPHPMSHHYPLTPRTPDSASEFILSNAPPMLVSSTSLNVANESGYDTPSNNYYSSQPSSLMSPDSGHYSLPHQQQQHHHHHVPQHHPLLLAPVFQHHHSPVNSVETSPSIYSDSSSFFSGTPVAPLAPVVSSNFYYTDCMEQNSEEDELLDAIVKWQED